MATGRSAPARLAVRAGPCGRAPRPAGEELHVGRWVGLISILAAIAVWVLWLLVSSGPSAVGPILTVLLAAALVGDVLAAAAVVRRRVGRPVLLWLVARLVLSIGSILFITILPYSLALIALSVPTFPNAPVRDPSQPHVFRPPTAAFLRPLTNIGWSQEREGMMRHTHGACAVCGRLEADAIHAPADEARPGA